MAATQPDLANNVKTLANTESLSTSGRWEWSDVDGSNWDQYWPYQLAILEVASKKEAESEFKIPRYSVYKGLTFTLPYSPESMQVVAPFAISVHATQDGVVEQHGGVPFRQIVFSGTFGIYFNRPMVEPDPTSISGITGGQLNGLSVGNAAQSTVNAVKGLVGLSTPRNLIKKTEVDYQSTGYWQCLQLRKFLESYAEVKRTAKGAKLRLALIQWKDQSAWLVTPQRFDVIRQANAPFEYKYSLQFQAWRRVHPNTIGLSSRGGTPSYRGPKRGPSVLQTAMNKLDQSRRVIDKATATLGAVRADVEKVMGILRTAALAIRAGVGFVKTAADMPDAIGKTIAKAVDESWDILKGSFSQNKDPRLAQALRDIELERAHNAAFASSWGENHFATQEAQSAASTSAHNAAFASAWASRQGGSRSGNVSPTLVNLMSGKGAASADFKGGIDLSTVILSPAQRDLIDAESRRAKNLSTADWKRMRDDVLSFMAGYADQLGLSSETYSAAKGRTTAAQIRQPSNDDFRILHSLASAVQAIDLVIGNTPPQQAPSVIEYVAGLANANGIEMRVPRSKFVVPFPFGGSLEKLAQQYLGDATRWMEIAELNELRAPYVDEEGTMASLLVNGQGSTVVVADARKLLVGQLVYIFSTTVTAEKRHIVNIQPAGTGESYVLTLDGDGDLNKLQVSDRARILSYQPGTVNCQQVIFIPSDEEATADVLKYLPSADDFQRILDRGEVDGMLTESGDLVVTPDGDWPFVLGYSNLVQWARVALNTKLGSMPLHTDFGLEGAVGQALSESGTAKAVLDEVKKTLTYHPSFLGVKNATVTLNGPTLALGLELAVRGSDALLPITFDISLDASR